MRAGNGKRVLVFAEEQGRKVAYPVLICEPGTYQSFLINKKAPSDDGAP